MPKFLRRISNRYSKLGKRRKKKQIWRRPTGRDNKMRERRKGYPARVSVGYKGENALRGLIKEKHTREVRKVESVLEKMEKLGATADYKNLSIAAKMCHILKIESKPMKTKQILDQAKALDWKINEDEAKAAIKFLKDIGLVEVKKAKKAKK